MESPQNNVIYSPINTDCFQQALRAVSNKATDVGFTNVITEAICADEFSIHTPNKVLNIRLDETDLEQFCVQVFDESNILIGSIVHFIATGKDVVSLENGQCFEWDYLSSDHSTSMDSYLAWLLVSLSLDFTIEDSALISRSALHVSCETWPSDITHFPKLSKHQPESVSRKVSHCVGLYPVVDTIELVEELIDTGVKILQLRIKDKHSAEVSEDIKRAIEIGRKANVDIVINDYWQLALEHGASCLHLGQEDLAELNDSSVLNSNIGLGISTHGYFEIINALQYKPSYLALGHIFPTTTKDMPSSPQGLVKLKLYQALITSISTNRGALLPTVAIGGIDLMRAPMVIETGVTSVAVVRAVTQAKDKHQAVQQFQSLFSLQSQACEKQHAF
ncbi:thiamine-phosphate diphosphorylase [Vibrio sp. UCD-FRSSP16_10]|uniref:thiamine phosphate synthase n=1 Tax=unclassified Vibrio TaxID=2614977 RepID=UPI0007FFDA58|nr:MULTISPECIES: thiamine phosphate synthase [unclassified Vibrio]OBT12897.1 thiamine-phosphate diphosphorylase [Vibrio sp. UCD-FRSSP16_30]OBT18360.1 thiamine-phosphate diphosphorylase [Vibrio sp. UCD-FRSSP16_10]